VDAAKGDSALLNAVMGGQAAEAERLLSDGVPANCCDAQRRSPLHYAAYSGDRALCALLCDFDANLEATDASVRAAVRRVSRVARSRCGLRSLTPPLISARF
jgi:ankyrin repeat protein